MKENLSILFFKFYTKCSFLIKNTDTGELKTTIAAHSAYVNTLGTINREMIVSASQDRSVKVWDLVNGNYLLFLNQYKD